MMAAEERDLTTADLAGTQRAADTETANDDFDVADPPVPTTTAAATSADASSTAKRRMVLSPLV